jgi:PAS domain S-box-containing protein
MTEKAPNSESAENIISNSNYQIDQELYSLIINGISEGIVVADKEGRIIFVNEAFTTTYGYSKEELIGKSTEVIHSAKINSMDVKDIVPQTLQGGWSGRLVASKKDGTEISIELKTTPVRNAEGKLIALVGVVRDLTEELKNQDAIDDARGKYATLFTELRDAVYESTPDGRLTDLNPAGMQLFGFESREEMLNCNVTEDLYVNKEDGKRFKKLLERDGYVKNFEFEIKRKYGVTATVYETSVGVKDKDGNIKAYRGILRDITNIKKQELQLREFVEKLAKLNEQLRESETELKKLNASKDKFFSIIAHDLRSPFSSLLGFSEFLEQDINELTSEEISTFAGKINESARNVFSLLENLLQWSRIQTGRMSFEPVLFNIANRITQCVNILSDNSFNKGIELICVVDPEIMVFADENMVTSVVQNLMGNAIKFTKPGGSITISSKESDDFVEFSVRDTGIGMKEEDVAKLFRIDVHHTTMGTNDEKGTGLGLILCNELITKNSGKMRVESKFGEGSKFYFTLPKFQKH